MRKIARARPVTSPPPESSSVGTSAATMVEDEGTGRPPKKSRKVVNCEPCRTNKLKCDRNRPCSSCELRGTSSQCYRDNIGADSGFARCVDPLGDLGKMRQSLALLERFYQASNNPRSPINDDQMSMNTVAASPVSANSPATAGNTGVGPGSRGGQAGGYYAGPTSTASHLLGNQLEYVDAPPLPSMKQGDNISDVLDALPGAEIIEGIVDYYFTNCQWLYLRIVESEFRKHWAHFKAGPSKDCLVLATCCGILALTMVYIPDEHPLKVASAEKLGANPGQKFYALLETTQRRYEAGLGGLSYSLDYAEFLLLRAHYHQYLTHDAEEVWGAKSHIMSVATAMGLHRDPSQWKMPVEVAERRRWLWWNILTLDRSQSFVLGRPPSIANHHFDTQLPSLFSDPSQDLSAYDPSLRLFSLVAIVGDILNTVLSLLPVPYLKIKEFDRKLECWEKNLPSGWFMDGDQIENGIGSDDFGTRQRTLQVTIIIAWYYFIRLTLHRQYAARPIAPAANGEPASSTEWVESTEIASTYAERLIGLSMRCRRDQDPLLGHLFATRAHLDFHIFYLFSAAMFFSFQLINTPAGVRSAQCRSNIVQARAMLRTTPDDMPGSRLAANATKILDTLAPLWEDDFVHMPAGSAKDMFKSERLKLVRTLAFPFHQSDMAAPETGGGGIHGVNPATIPRTSGPNQREPALVQAAIFGNRGILRPDMSVSGRVPIINTTSYPHHSHNQGQMNGSLIEHNVSSQSSKTNGSGTAARAEASAQPMMQFTHPDSLPPGYNSPAEDSSHSLFVHGLSHIDHPRHTPTTSNPPPYVHAEAGHRMYNPSANSGLDSYNYGVDVGGHGQEMSWGAGVGITAGEWAGFMQTMAGSPVSMGGTAMTQPTVVYEYNQDHNHHARQHLEHTFRGDHM